ncbi:MAG TPA: DPP IV N-terminal domain-containing protein, partial [Bacteroidia bacterium]
LLAQTKMLSIEDAVLGQRTYLAPKRLNQLGWIPGTDTYFFLSGEKNTDLMMGKNGGAAKKAVTLSKINQQLRQYKFDTLKSFPELKFEPGGTFSFITGKKNIAYWPEKQQVHDTTSYSYDPPSSAANIDEFKSAYKQAYTIENNLFIVIGGKNIQVTNDADKNIVNGQSVHREEWGIYKGTFWSPKGNYLAFYRMDQTMVTDYPIVDLTQHPASAENIKYPMAGSTSHQVTVGIYNVFTKQTVFLKTGEPKDHYLINPEWSPDEKHIYVAILNREQNHLWFNSYNVSSGEFERTLFEETNDKYVHPMHPPLFVKDRPDLFIWQSERDGYNNLYLYKTDGTLVRQLTNYAAPNVRRAYYTIVTDVLGFDEKGVNVYYTAVNSRNLLGREIRVAAIDGSHDDAITSGDGTHTAVLSPSGKYLIDTYSSISVPREISIIDKKGKKIQALLTAENPLKDYKLGQVRLFSIKAADNNTDLFCRMTFPIDFDSTKKYPAIVYLYNGPNVQLVTNSWLAGSDLWYQYMAEHGFIVFTVDGRGSANRGLAFEQCTFRHLGTEEMNDQLKGVDYLKSKSYIDASRLGVFGWSYGGFMTTSLMTRHAGVFKCAVAGGPVIDWSYYEVMYTERYMDTPKENPDGYKENSLLNYAQNLKGKLLIIHGTSDPVVVWQHSLLFLKKCVEKGTYPDYLVYPGHEHNVLGKDRAHLFHKITDYFMQNL